MMSDVEGEYEMSPTPGRLEVTIKINELPIAETVENNWQQFHLDCDGRLIQVTVKPKVWRKLTDAEANYPMWVAAIAGKMGKPIEGGFVLDQASIQVFERKPKAPKEPKEEKETKEAKEASAAS